MYVFEEPHASRNSRHIVEGHTLFLLFFYYLRQRQACTVAAYPLHLIVQFPRIASHNILTEYGPSVSYRKQCSRIRSGRIIAYYLYVVIGLQIASYIGRPVSFEIVLKESPSVSLMHLRQQHQCLLRDLIAAIFTRIRCTAAVCSRPLPLPPCKVEDDTYRKHNPGGYRKIRHHYRIYISARERSPVYAGAREKIREDIHQ